jgi:hypothetical protein
MTIEQICCVCIGGIIQAGVFALGLLVGASLRRKDSTHETAKGGAARSHGFR